MGRPARDRKTAARRRRGQPYLPAVHGGRDQERHGRGSLRRPRGRREWDGAGRLSLHDQSAGLVGMVRRDDRDAGRPDRDVARRWLGFGAARAGGVRGETGGERMMDRREFLAVGAGWVLAARQTPDSGAGPSGRLYDPTWAGPSAQPVTARDNDRAIQAIEKRIKCTCGCGLDVYTCRTTDFTCPVSPKMHAQVLALVDAGNSPDQILAEFVREHGVEVLMAPKLPWVNVSVGVVFVAAVALLLLSMRRWVRRAQATAAPATADAPPNPAELERLRQALLHTDA